MSREIKSPARKQVYAFVKIDYGQDYVFDYEGGITAADLFVKNMRTELSRLRKKAENLGRTVIPFRMKVISMEEIANTNGGSPILTRITLQRVKTTATIVTEELGGVLNSISLETEVTEGQE